MVKRITTEKDNYRLSVAVLLEIQDGQLDWSWVYLQLLFHRVQWFRMDIQEGYTWDILHGPPGLLCVDGIYVFGFYCDSATPTLEELATSDILLVAEEIQFEVVAEIV